MNDIPRVPVPPGTGRHRLPRQSTEEAVSFPGGAGVPFAHDLPLVREIIDDGWDAAVVQELGPEMAELWDTAEQPAVPDGPDPLFPPGGAVYWPGEPAYLHAEAVHPPAEPAYPHAEAGYPHAEAGYPYAETAYPHAESAHRPAAPTVPAAPGPQAAEARAMPGAGRVAWTWRRLLSASSVLLTAVIGIAVSALGAVASYPPLRAIADGVAPSDVAALWPLLIYGPWVVATLSILRARVHRRRTLHSWAVVIFFAAVAMMLCIARVHPSPSGIAVAGLPPLTVLLCFHQFVRQLDLAGAPQPAARHAQSSRGQHRHRSGG
ncbi:MULTISPECIES: DUF2637 domain-containing protein [Streptomyces]|nr:MULTISPECIES: DUF2637 domain-containing protein [Streptomyces]KEF09366.1 hypothetical protein DF17_03240 [Streptomyces rimosus]KUJ38429.1 hypothetical protein ADK46_14475 [Streptomyces rimosus subsp. rimosus]UNZ02400.1 hypothetical protein SRIMR7_09590 [Streptomyces rimosus subsp. rimosus]UTH93952.1 hypothetical protein SRIMHP_07420 [Streptomyces rimosus subsp. rimosus]UTJ12047.1 hypothetical protein SRIMDV3_07315 [Streptomyces rimosus subsp. rimosus]